MKLRIPFERVNWVTSIFLIGTLATALTAVPWYLWNYGMNGFEFGLFMFYTFATGLSITLGYHRLFSHLAFKAKWPVRLFVLVFGAAAFENAALEWVSDHRRHHKFVDHDDDPYNISLGFFHAHIGWMLFKLRPEPPLDNVNDLLKDKLVVFQYKFVQWIAVFVGFIVPTLLGYWHGGGIGALGGLLIPGILRTVFIQQGTFCINSFCHLIGRQTYSSKCSARDSWLMAFVTFGEGYHNYHHEFQHDYRNGVKAWQWDPTKWTIWLLSKLGLASDLRRVPDWRICLAEIDEAHRQMELRLKTLNEETVPSIYWKKVDESLKALRNMSQQWTQRTQELQNMAKEQIDRISKDMAKEIRHEINIVNHHLDKLNELARRFQPETIDVSA